MPKNSDILNAARNLPYLENYIKWMTSAENRQPNIGKGAAKKQSQKLLVVPFTLRLPDGTHAATSGALPTWEKYQAAIGGHAVAVTAANVATAFKLERFTAARIHIITGRTPAGERGIVKTSHITGRKYTTRGGHSTSLPFGKAAAADTEDAVFATLSADIRQESATGVEIAFTPEKSSPVSAA